MSAKIPFIHVYMKRAPKKKTPGMAGRIAVIGAFETGGENPIYCDSIEDAYDKLGTDTTGYNGNKVLEYLFRNTDLDHKGCDGIIAVNITTVDTSGETPVIQKDLTPEKLASALAKIKRERFDILFIANILDNNTLTNIKPFLADRILNKLPVGYIGAIANTTKEQYLATKELVEDSCYGIIANQTVTLDGKSLDLLETSAYYCGLIAGMNVGYSFTQKTLPDVTAISPEYTFETGDLGTSVVLNGFTAFDCYDRENSTYIVVNSEQPTGLDLYINRVRDYVIREFALHDFLGEKNRPKTHDQIMQEIGKVKKECIENLELLEDIVYDIEKVSPSCVNIYIRSLLFAGVITEINVYVTLEVE